MEKYWLREVYFSSRGREVGPSKFVVHKNDDGTILYCEAKDAERSAAEMSWAAANSLKEEIEAKFRKSKDGVRVVRIEIARKAR